MNLTERMLARSVAKNITVTTPGRVTLHQIIRKRHAPVLVALAWLPILASLVLAAAAVITR